MNKLIDELKQFDKEVCSVVSVSELQKAFSRLAPAFLYGGYIQVRTDYKIYIRTVEFYFHSEKENGVHDPIVYHRNGNGLVNVPYFPLMTLHSHDSGFDITFESEQHEYRASALIRGYEVKNNNMYLEWDKKSMFKAESTYKFNTQSLYLRKLLNGFALSDSNDIKWVDEARNQSLSIIEKNRRNVYQYDKDGNKVKCERLWSFTRVDQI
jgi:hypothetical protein